jgi:hypothetical protein
MVHMLREQLLERLHAIMNQGNLALRTLETKPQTPETVDAARTVVQFLRNDLEREFSRTCPERVQRAMTMFELSVYAPTIEEAWKGSGISRLRLDAEPSKKWIEALEAVVYTAGKYIS